MGLSGDQALPRHLLQIQRSQSVHGMHMVKHVIVTVLHHHAVYVQLFIYPQV